MASKNGSTVADNDTFLGSTIDLADFFNGKDMWEAAESGGMEPLPDGTYNAEVVQMTGPHMNKAGNGKYLKVQYKVTDEDYFNQRVWQNLSLKEQSMWNVAKTFRALGKAVGDSSYTEGEFDNVPCRIVVEYKPAQGEYRAGNNVKAVLPVADESDTTTSWP